MKHKISVIVPVYNVKNFLDKCIESVINQTYKNIEILLIDDGSTDGSELICDKYQEIDSRIKVFHKKNGGLSSARNFGLDNISGDYVFFLDSDDWIRTDCLELLLDGIIKHDATVAIGRIKNVPLDSYLPVEFNEKNIQNKKYKTYYYNKKEAIFNLLTEYKFSNSACSKLFKSSLFKNGNNYFPEGRLYEDIPVVYNIFLSEDKFIFLDTDLYFYTYRTSSISRSSFKESRMDAIYFIEEYINKILQIYPEFKNISYIKLFNVYYSIYISFNNKDFSDYKTIVSNKIKKIRIKVIFNKYISTKIKIKCFLSFFGLKILKFFERVHNGK